MTRPTIIMAAPNGARKDKTDHPAMPVTIVETIAAARNAMPPVLAYYMRMCG